MKIISLGEKELPYVGALFYLHQVEKKFDINVELSNIVLRALSNFNILGKYSEIIEKDVLLNCLEEKDISLKELIDKNVLEEVNGNLFKLTNKTKTFFEIAANIRKDQVEKIIFPKYA